MTKVSHFLFFPLMWLSSLLTPRCITMLPSPALPQPPNTLDPLSHTYGNCWRDWLMRAPRRQSFIPSCLGSENGSYGICEFNPNSKRASWVYMRSRQISPSPKEDIDERSEWFLGGKQCCLESTVRLKSHKVMTGKEPHFRIHRQFVNNK